MAATFDVRGTSVLEDRKLFALEGAIRSGMVRTGMRASLPDAAETFSEPVHAVEHLASGDDEAGPVLAILVSYGSREKLDAWRAVDWEGRTLALRWQGAEA